uniref:Beta-glucosidase n=1 Tax=Panagrellus redivivus TaxID=6233 RepID=A0A7E4W8J6_PANRE
MALLKCALFLLLVVLFVTQSDGIWCNFGRFIESKNEMGVATVVEKECVSEYCMSNYTNDGQDIAYSLSCDDGNKCTDVGCIEDHGTGSQVCCCNEDYCIHDDASKPIEYPLDGILMSSATAAYQVEGAVDVDGRGPSIWDVWTKRPNVINNNDTGEIACDSYHNWKEDIALLKAMNVNQYRFSISWSRIFTDGTSDTLNPIGVQYYHDIIDNLIENGIEPLVTMYHWDLPQPIGDTGGWINPNTITKFADYAEFLFKEYGEKIKKWITINEPLMISEFEYCGEDLVHASGSFTPHCEWSVYVAAINLLRAHLTAWRIYESLDPSLNGGSIGIASGMTHFYADSRNKNRAEAEAAAERMVDFKWNMFLHPIFSETGDWPDSLKQRLAKLSKLEGRGKSRLPEFTLDEIEGLKGSAQFIGVNFYSAKVVSSIIGQETNRWQYKQREYDSGTVIWPEKHWREINVTNSWIHYTPYGLRALLNKINNLYPDVPIMVTENGVMDSLGEDLNDISRIHYIRGHLMAVSQAKHVDNVNVIGYTYWSLMDNFEWEDGYNTKFGLHRVDFKDPGRKRTPKASAHFFGKIIEQLKIEGFSPHQYW